MANSLRGETEIELGGKPRRLVFNGNSLAEIECTLHEGVIDLLVQMSGDFAKKRVGRMISCLRAFLWAGMHEVSPGIKLETVGRAMKTDMESLGVYLTKCTGAISEAMGINDPETKAKIEKAKKEAEDPLAAVTAAPEAAVPDGSTSQDSGEKPSSGA